MHKLKIQNIIPRENHNVTINFEPISGSYPSYKAGQFLTLSFEFGDREVRRSYSFSSSPDVDEPLSITVKRVENGEISRFLHHKIGPNDVVNALDPQGLFTYEPIEDSDRTVFLFAAGIGITPLYSILKTALVRERKSKIILVYSNSSPELTPFKDELKDWEAKYPDRFKIVWIYSNNKNLMTARLNRDYILSLLKTHLQNKPEQALFYTCGPVIYMDLCRFTLLGIGFDEKQIKRETFLLPENEEDDDDGTEKVIDKTSYSIKLNFKGKSYDLEIPYNKSILDVGLEHKIKLPYSCKSGMCSTCISNCSQGKVRMDYNEVLTDREMENGRILLCTGHPVEEGTVVDVI
ncbi:ferredoxin--NADP reductase [Sphingobacterium sp. SRCM116780]|uniref:ferredoxin--NADP reductase n=1 Tax=Sphingobacterium sp. SRCM116780 TaxID=2907623 RepID=UPI001F282F52|nr:ferredoxin--NADP reductase [Sphingobacterium sp. SRCM116780]UIR57938.1 ferredoxin--NADP reductase [Sphingobacterium sp. SRCM116780]